jgi:hypothetical protein
VEAVQISWNSLARIIFGVLYLGFAIWTIRRRWSGLQVQQRSLAITVIEVGVLIGLTAIIALILFKT